MKLFESKVCFDDYYEKENTDLLYDCYIDPNNNGWNGWACPFLNQENYDKFIKNMNLNYCDDPEFIEEIKSYKSANINGMTLYSMGGSLCWNIEDDNFQEKRKDLLIKEEA
jgi:hypothetical protein